MLHSAASDLGLHCLPLIQQYFRHINRTSKMNMLKIYDKYVKDFRCPIFKGSTVLTFTTLWANSADKVDDIFSYFSQNTSFGISCKLSPLETVCMKYQNLFSGKNKKNMSICCLLKILPWMLSINWELFKMYHSIDQDGHHAHIW